mgnify:CR=1 FL=1
MNKEMKQLVAEEIKLNSASLYPHPLSLYTRSLLDDKPKSYNDLLKEAIKIKQEKELTFHFTSTLHLADF